MKSSATKGKMRVRRSKGESQQVDRLYKNIKQEKVIYSRWVSGAEATLTTTAGGVIGITTLANAAVVNSTSDFSSLAALYTAYRVKAIRVQLLPLYTAPAYTGAALFYAPCALAVFPWTSNTVPTTFAQALDVTGCKVVSGYREAVINTSWKGDPDAHLWTGTGAAIGSNEQFGISVIGSATASSASTTVMKVLSWYLVEFRMAG